MAQMATGMVGSFAAMLMVRLGLGVGEAARRERWTRYGAGVRKPSRQQPLCSQIDPEVEAWPSTRHLRPRLEQCRGGF